MLLHPTASKIQRTLASNKERLTASACLSPKQLTIFHHTKYWCSAGGLFVCKSTVQVYSFASCMAASYAQAEDSHMTVCQGYYDSMVPTCPQTARRAAARLSCSKRTALLSGCSTRVAPRHCTAASGAGWGGSCNPASLAVARGAGRDRTSSSCSQADRYALISSHASSLLAVASMGSLPCHAAYTFEQSCKSWM